MPDRNGSKTTSEGRRLKQSHQQGYEKWWLGKMVKTKYLDNDGNQIRGRVKNVKYIGNSVYGVVEITLECGFEFMVSSSSFRPRKKDLESC